MIYAIIKSIKEKKIKELIPILLISIACIGACILLPWFFLF